MTLEPMPHALRQTRSAQLRQIEFALDRFPRPHRARVKAEAATHFALADLALSFPALLFAIAVPHAGFDAAEMRRMVIAGQPLKQLARAATLPLWLRHLKPQAFAEPLDLVPRGELVARQIANFIPPRAKHQADWLRCVVHACRWGNVSYALWVARVYKPQPHRTPIYQQAILALWAWYSARKDTEFGRLVQKRWRMNMDMKQARMACNDWIESVHLHLNVHIEERPPKFSACTVDGFDFIHLASGKMLADEAMAMRNCIKSYGYDIAHHGVELWSMRQNGERVASLCIGNSRVDSLPAIIEIKCADNKDVPKQVAIAARRWQAQHEVAAINLVQRDLEFDAVRPVWQRGFKPYWQEKKTIPRWLRMAGSYELRRV